MRDKFDEKEHNEHDPLFPIEEEDNAVKDATLESELWTLENTQDTTTVKHVPVQVRPMVARLRERVAKVATEETGTQQVRAWKLSLSLDKMLFHTFLGQQTDQQYWPYQGNQDPYCADPGRKRV